MRRKTIHLLTYIVILVTSWTGAAYAEDLLRIEIKKDGVYYIYPTDLQNAGVPTDIDPGTIKIFNQGVEIPIYVYVYGGGDGRLTSSGYIEFYAEGISRDSEYYEFTDTNIYWLAWGGAAGKRMIPSDGTSGSIPPPSSFVNHLHVEKDAEWWWEKPDTAEDDHWFWETIRSGESKEYPFTIRNINRTTGDCAVRVSVHGKTDVFVSPDHHTRVYLNGNLLKEEEWDGIEPKEWEIYGVRCDFLNEGENLLKIEAAGVPVTDPNLKDFIDLDKDGILDIDSIYLNWFEIDYRDTYTAEGDYLKFTGTGSGEVDFVISNFNDTRQSIAVLDITGFPYEVYRFNNITKGNGFPYTVSFRDLLQGGQQKEYIATATHMGLPHKMEKYSPSSSLRNSSNRADYIIITHGDIYEEALRLADHRKVQGLKSAVVKVNDIYDEFSHGIFTPGAIRDFLKYAYTSWSLRPRYVVLFGDANYDYKDIYNYGEANMVPTYLVPGEFGLIPTDNWFVDVEGDILPELMIGRIPAKNALEAKGVVDKIIRYETEPEAPWQKNMLFVADDNDIDFERLGDTLATGLPSDYTGKKVYLRSYCNNGYCDQLSQDARNEAGNKARADVASGFDSGALVTVYAGHGDIDQWADENMINSYYLLGTTTGESILKNYERPSFVITLNCLNGFFPLPNEGGLKNKGTPGDIPLAEAFLKLDRRGALAVWSPTSLSYTREHEALAGHLFDALFKEGRNVIGEAILRAKTLAYQQNDGISGEIVHMYTLFGDPATRLALPANNTEEDTTSESSGNGGSGGGGCFIATAAYGSYFHPYVQVLRTFRDRLLLPTALGRKLVETYYNISPPAAKWISGRPWAKGVTQAFLLPIISIAWIAVEAPGWAGGVFLALSILCCIPLVLRGRSS